MPARTAPVPDGSPANRRPLWSQTLHTAYWPAWCAFLPRSSAQGDANPLETDSRSCPLSIESKTSTRSGRHQLVIARGYRVSRAVHRDRPHPEAIAAEAYARPGHQWLIAAGGGGLE